MMNPCGHRFDHDLELGVRYRESGRGVDVGGGGGIVDAVYVREEGGDGVEIRVEGEVDGGVFAGVDSGVGREPGRRRRGLGRRCWGFRIWGYVKMSRRH